MKRVHNRPQKKVVGEVVHSLTQVIQLIDKKSYIEISDLKDLLSDAKEVIIGLSNIVAVNSTNSSLPPSKDTHKKKRKTKGKKRKPGGQKGHKGNHLKPVEEPTYIEELIVDRSTIPAGEYITVGVEKRQVFDISISVVVTEYQAEILEDQDGVQFVAEFPEGVTEQAQYGNSVKAHSVYMSQYQLIPYGRVAEYFKNQMGMALSKGSVFNWNETAYDLLQPFSEWAFHELVHSRCNSVDETGINFNGKNIWLHSVSNENAVLFHADEKRGKDAMDRMGILPKFHGVLVHDHWKPYFQYECIHALCNAHHLRELQAAIDFDKQKWAAKMQKLLCKMNDAVIQAKKDKKTLSEDQVSAFLSLYKILLVAAEKECPKDEKNRKQSKSRNLLTRLIDFQEETLLFLKNPLVPFTNNRGENDLRMTKVQQKISGCFKSFKGAQMFCRIRSYLLSCQRHDIEPTEALTLLFDNKLPSFMYHK